MDQQQIRKLIKAHLEDGSDECRWCFSVNLERVKGTEFARYEYPDGTLFLFLCPRCGGVFTYHVDGWNETYVKKIIYKLHSELKGTISDELFKEVSDRVLFKFNLDEYLDFDACPNSVLRS